MGKTGRRYLNIQDPSNPYMLTSCRGETRAVLVNVGFDGKSWHKSCEWFDKSRYNFSDFQVLEELDLKRVGTFRKFFFTIYNNTSKKPFILMSDT